MDRGKRVKVLVVDDSVLFRQVLQRGLSSEPGIEVIATASDPFEASEKIIRYNPDVVTCDIEMPRMNGIEFVKRLMPQYPVPVIMVSTVSKAVFEAMSAGAMDFVVKPDVSSVNGVKDFILDLIAKIKVASLARISNTQNAQSKHAEVKCIKSKSQPAGLVKPGFENKIIALGASTGGTEAITKVLRDMPENVPGIVITQHIPPVFSRMFAERLNTLCKLQVKEAASGDIVMPGKAFIAPGNMHMKVKRIENKYKIECFTGEKVNGHCPSVDVLFESVAKEAGKNAMGIIMTGMGYDGAKGLLSMRRRGARTLGQDEATSVVYGMPKVALDLGAVEKQVPLHRMYKAIEELLMDNME